MSIGTLTLYLWILEDWILDHEDTTYPEEIEKAQDLAYELKEIIRKRRLYENFKRSH